MTTPARLAVMLSGSGRTLLNLLEHIRGGTLSARIELVIASREGTGAERARAAGLTTLVIPGEVSAERLGALLHEHRIDLVALAGYLKLVTIPPGYEGRIVNIHPALLPDFGGPGMYGQRVHEAVIRSGAKVTGCTVHLIDEHFDRGTILLQEVCPIHPGDTPAALADRVFALECQALPEALQRLITRGVSAVRTP